jgi:hypothetical protein
MIVLDVNLTNRTLSLLGNHDKDHSGLQWCVFIRNTYQQVQDFKYQLIMVPTHWCVALDKDIALGLHVVILINSVREAKALYKDIIAKYLEKFVKIYTGDTDQEVKKHDITNIAAKWSACEILIYTDNYFGGEFQVGQLRQNLWMVQSFELLHPHLRPNAQANAIDFHKLCSFIP